MNCSKTFNDINVKTSNQLITTNNLYKFKGGGCVISLDLETTAYKENVRPKVYAWGLLIANQDLLLKNGVNKIKYLFTTLNTLKKEGLINVDIKDNGFTYITGINLNPLFELLGSSSKTIYIIMQNGAKFDLHFINYYMQQNKKYSLVFDYSDKLFNEGKNEILKWDENNDYICNEASVNYFNKVSDTYEDRINKMKLFDNDINDENAKAKFGWLYPNDYRYLLDHNKRFISYEVGISSKSRKARKYNKLIFYDCYAQFSQPLEAKGYEIGISKLDNEYNKTALYNNVSEFVNDSLEYKYLYNDVLITYIHTLITYKQLELTSIHFKPKLTASSIAFNIYRQEFIDEKIKEYQDAKLISDKFKYPRVIKYLVKDEFKKALGIDAKIKWVPNNILRNAIWNNCYKTDWLKKANVKHSLHKFYTGGLTIVNEKYRGLYINDEDKKIKYYDINSAYPYVMQTNAKAPYGEPIKIDDNKLFNSKYYSFITITPKKNISNNDVLPFLYQTDKYNSRDITNKLIKNVNYVTNSTELPYVIKQYCNNSKEEFFNNFEYEIKFMFKSISIGDYFKTFITKFYEKKKNAKTPCEKSTYKFLICNVYGKLGQKTDRGSYIKEGNEYIKWTNEHISEYYYPLACVVTSLTRMMLVNTVNDNYRYFVYCDTDSLIFNANDKAFKDIENNIEIDKSKLGAFDLEGEFNRGLFRRPKQYMLYNDKLKNVKLVCAGVNFNKEIANYKMSLWDYANKVITPSKYFYGFETTASTQVKKVEGGIYILNTIKFLDSVWGYKPKKDQIELNEDDFIRKNGKNMKYLRKNSII